MLGALDGVDDETVAPLVRGAGMAVPPVVQPAASSTAAAAADNRRATRVRTMETTFRVLRQERAGGGG